MKWFYLVIFAFVSCVQENLGPEAALKNFIEIRIGNVVPRDAILEKVTGKMKQSLENISDEDFEKFSDLRNVKKSSFKILSKSCQEKTCYITYSISYETIKEDKTFFSSEVKKIAELVQEKENWLIADVSNIKTYHESLEPINP